MTDRWLFIPLLGVLFQAILAVAPVAAQSSEPHERIFEEDRFPSARVCAQCHPRHFSEWSLSPHAYAQLSPVFNAMQGRILQLTNGTNGDFCIRCHTPVGMTMGEDEFMRTLERHPTSREGVTCVVCHRVSEEYGKISGRLSLEEGDITRPIHGPRGDGSELARVMREGGVSSDPETAGRKVHGSIRPFFKLTEPGFCGSCHDVTLLNGFRLEEAFSEYRNSPASKAGVTCQDCHMGKEPGKILAEKSDPEFESHNYHHGSAAEVSGIKTAPRKLTFHGFVGPDYSVLPPFVFPYDPKIVGLQGEKDGFSPFATLREWLDFDVEAGWGTDEYEDEVSDDQGFPERWTSVDDRYDGREIIEENQKRLDEVSDLRLTLLRNGYQLGDVTVLASDEDGVRFQVEVRNGTDGHNVPTGFDAERLVWLAITVRDGTGSVIFRSGDLDPNGDLRDAHSAYVHHGELSLDDQLFNLQSKFLTRNLRGGEREQILSVNTSASVLPFLRPERSSSILRGNPRSVRKQKKAIEPNGRRTATFEVKKELLTGSLPYTAHVQLKAGMIPVHLVNEIKDVGFDYGLSARDVAVAVVAGHQVIWEREVELVKDGDS